MKPSSFPTFAICGLDELLGHQGRGVTHILSILDPEWPEPAAFKAFDPHFRATLRFHDAIEPDIDVLLPQRGDVDTILTFGRGAAEAGPAHPPPCRNLSLDGCHADDPGAGSPARRRG